jgi:rRNA-processing protein FCF1
VNQVIVITSYFGIEIISMEKGDLPIKLILDANFLFIPSKFRIDVFEELANLVNQRFEPILLSTTLQELQAMAEQGSPTKRKQASFALSLAQRCRQVKVERKVGETSDDVILKIAVKWQSPVATNDIELRRKLRARNIPVIFLRGKSRLELEGAL